MSNMTAYLVQPLKLMIARRCGIRDICAITGYSKGKVQRTIARSNYIHSSQKGISNKKGAISESFTCK